MRILFGVFLVIGGLCGAAMSILSSVVVDSPVLMIHGMELSLALAVFSTVAFLSGLYNLFLAS